MAAGKASKQVLPSTKELYSSTVSTVQISRGPLYTGIKAELSNLHVCEGNSLQRFWTENLTLFTHGFNCITVILRTPVADV